MPRNLLILVGPKGAGKTRIGRALERSGLASFVRVEPIFKAAQARGRDAVPEVVDAVLSAAGQVVCIETTGASREMLDRYASLLGDSFVISYLRVQARQDLYARRVRERDPADHIDVSDELVAEVNRRAALAQLPWCLTIDTTNERADSEIVAAVKTALHSLSG